MGEPGVQLRRATSISASSSNLFEVHFSKPCADGSLTPNSLVVMERRRGGIMHKIDDATIERSSTRGVIHRNLALQQSSPAWESLLWAPDVVSWSARQLFLENNTQFIKPWSGSLQMIQVRQQQRSPGYRGYARGPCAKLKGAQLCSSSIAICGSRCQPRRLLERPIRGPIQRVGEQLPPDLCSRLAGCVLTGGRFSFWLLFER